MSDAWVIGSGEDCDLRITDDPYVSTRHCAIARIGDRYALSDLGSTNGTYWRRGDSGWVKCLGPTPIVPGTEIKVGRTVIPWRDQ
jgi:pSer/pThr/pTyr-binding forkhead associated (FHA) protein